MIDEPFYTVEEVAGMLRVSAATVYRKVQSESWPHHRIGNAIRFGEREIEGIKELTRQKPKEASTLPRNRPRVGTRARRSTRIPRAETTT